jgi:hypothetical protein
LPQLFFVRLPLASLAKFNNFYFERVYMLSVPENAMWIVMGVAVFIQFLKEFQMFTNGYGKFLPYVAILLGIGGTGINDVCVSNLPFSLPNMITGGIGCGLMAIGSYETLKKIGTKLPSIPKSLVILLCLALFISGCGKVWMSADYERQVKTMNKVVAERDKRCQAGDANSCRDGLHAAATTLQLIVDGLDDVNSLAVKK